jgi:predicted nucleic acid-binding protein
MTPVVVDASVAIKWYVREIHYEEARRLLTAAYERIAPDLMPIEFGNILWKKVRRGEVSNPDATSALHLLLQVPLLLLPSDSLIEDALSLALASGRTVYDCVYLALALRERCQLVTADQRLVNSLATTSYAASILRVEDIP